MGQGDALRKPVLQTWLVISVFALSAVSAGADPVDRSCAAPAARAWYELRFRDARGPKVSGAKPVTFIAPDTARLIVAKGRTIAYAFDTPGGGCIAIAADDEQAPVFYYSLHHRLTVPGVPPAQEIMESFADKIAQLQDERNRKTRAAHPFWNLLAQHATPEGAVDTLAAFPSGPTGPLLTSTWSQEEPYNDKCPMYQSQRCVVGCVATAMAQIMRYWRYPATGTGRHCYFWELGGMAPCADFGFTRYDWANMPDEATPTSPQADKDAVSTLCYHCGVSVDTDYSPYESAAWHYRAAVALTQYFGYEPAQFLGQTGGVDLQVWYDMMCDQIRKGQPVMYGTKYHEFVLDGYDSPNLVHFNMGWGGEEDGWYAIDHFPLDSATVDAVVDIRPYHFEIAEIVKAQWGRTQLRWTSYPEDTYIVWSSVDLETDEWFMEAVLSSQGDTTSWTNTSPVERIKFYRVQRTW